MARQHPGHDYYHGGYGPGRWTTQAPPFDNTFPFRPTMPTYHTAPSFMPQPGPWNYTQQYWDTQTFSLQHPNTMPAIAPLRYPDSLVNPVPSFTAHPPHGFIIQPPAPSNNHQSPDFAQRPASSEQSLTVRAKNIRPKTAAPVATTSAVITKPPTVKNDTQALSVLKPEPSRIAKRPAAEKRKSKRERQKFKAEQTERMLERAFKDNDYDAESTLKEVKRQAISALGPVIHKDAPLAGHAVDASHGVSHERPTRSMMKEGHLSKGPTPSSGDLLPPKLSHNLYDTLWAHPRTEQQEVRAILDG